MRRRLPSRTAFRPAPEALEGRSLLTVAFQIDYSLDTKNFFAGNPGSQQIFEQVAETIGSRLTDQLLPISSSGTNTWQLNFKSPADGSTVMLDNQLIPGNTIRVYVGGRDLSANPNEAGLGATGGYSASGDPAWLNLVAGRGQFNATGPGATDYGPWGGSIAFDTSAQTKWYFGTNPPAAGSGQTDFASVAFHELMHVIGFGTSQSWKNLAPAGGAAFNGPISKSNFDGPGVLTVSPDGGHWAQGTTDGGKQPVMVPTITTGTRNLPTRLDWAGLQDVGWTLSSDANGTIATASPGISGPGSQTYLTPKIGGDGTVLDMSDGADVDMYKINAQAGEIFTATTKAHLQGVPVDTYLRLFDATGKELKSANTGGYDTLMFTIPSDGSYYLGVSSAGNTAYSPVEDLAGRLAGPTGDYDLTLRLDPASGGVSSDLATLVSAPSTVVQGDPLVYSVTVGNAGPDAAGAARFTQTLPPSVTFVSALNSVGGAVTVTGGVLTAELGTLAPGGTATVQITVIPKDTTPLTLTATAASNQADPTPANNVASAGTTVTPRVGPIQQGDTTPPTITGRVQVVTSGKGRRRTFGLIVTFSESVVASQANNLGNFLLTRPGKARRGKPVPRIPVGVKTLSYNDSSHTVTLVPAIKGSLTKGLKLTVSGGGFGTGIHDLANNELDGDGNGSAGGDSVLNVS